MNTGVDRTPNPPTPPGSASEEVEQARFSDQELGLILKRAAELQEGVSGPTASRFSLAEIKEIAAEAGIDPVHVAAAAAVVRGGAASRESWFLGAPWRFRFDQSISGEVADDVIGELIDIARRELGMQGRVTEALGAVEWYGRDSFGSVHVSVTRRGGRTSIAVLAARSDAAAVAGISGVLGSAFGGLGLAAALVSTAGLIVPVAAIAGLAGASGASWFSMRGVWRRIARRWSHRVTGLGSEILEAARGAAAAGRIARR